VFLTRSNREQAKKAWELEQCRRVAEAINEAEDADYEAQPPNAEPADAVLVRKSKKFVQRPAQVVSIPLDFRAGGERVRYTASVALQQMCSLLMTARSRAYDAAPRWPKRSLCTCGLPQAP
jgi:hypothetical protein